MEKNLLVAAAITAGTAAFFYFFMKKNKLVAPVPQPQKSRHLTDVFAKAKL